MKIGPRMASAIFWLLFLALLFWGVRRFERANLYFPEKTFYAFPADYRLPFEAVSFIAEDGKQIKAWYVPPANAQSAVLILSPGNAGNRGYRLPKIALFHSLGYGVLAYDYRGYGDSEGVPSEKGTYRDALAAYDWLVSEKKIAQERIVSFGESLGCAMALELALKRPVRALIIESPFTSIVEMGKEHFPFLPVKLMVSFKYDNKSRMPGLKVPLLIVHSPQDEIVPFRMGRELFELAPHPKSFVEIHGTHNDGYQMAEKIYAAGVKEFLEQLP